MTSTVLAPAFSVLSLVSSNAQVEALELTLTQRVDKASELRQIGMMYLLESAAEFASLKQDTGKKEFSKLINKAGLLFSEVKKTIKLGEVAALLPAGVAHISSPTQLQALAGEKMQNALAVIQPGDTMLDVEAVIKQERAIVKANEPPKPPAKAMAWKQNQAGGGRRLIVEIQDSDEAIQLLHLYEEKSLTITQFFREILKRLYNSESAVPTNVVEVPTNEINVDVELSPPGVYPTENVENQVQLDRWKQGWNVGDVVVANEKDTRLVEWTGKKEVKVHSVIGKVGTIQFVQVIRPDGKTFDTFGNWIDDASVRFVEDQFALHLNRLNIAIRWLVDYQAKPYSLSVESLIESSRFEVELAKQEFLELGRKLDIMERVEKAIALACTSINVEF